MSGDTGWWSVWWVEAIGLVAGVLTTFASLPQVIKVWRTRSTSDISLIMLMMAVAGITLWLIYGIAIHSMVVTLAITVLLLLYTTVLGFKLRYR
ncbi:MAG: SemiSWEET transporter [Rhodospirillaceae bacterium]|nr:SemiSWEET transporter [Rhodospirillaceae bacterium]